MSTRAPRRNRRPQRRRPVHAGPLATPLRLLREGLRWHDKELFRVGQLGAKARPTASYAVGQRSVDAPALRFHPSLDRVQIGAGLFHAAAKQRDRSVRPVDEGRRLDGGKERSDLVVSHAPKMAHPATRWPRGPRLRLEATVASGDARCVVCRDRSSELATAPSRYSPSSAAPFAPRLRRADHRAGHR